MSPTTETITTTTKTARHRFRRTLAVLVALAAALATMSLAAGDAQAKKGGKPPASAPGSVIAFTSYRDGNAEIYTMNSDGSNQQRLTKNDDINAADKHPT